MRIFFINIIILILLKKYIFTQGLIINATNLYLTSNSNLILSGNAKWINNGHVICANGSNVKFVGNSLQEITGSNSTTFSNVYINNTGGGVYLGNNITILNNLTLTLGHFDLKNYICDLSTSGSVVGENENARIRATNSAGAEGQGTGIILALRDNPSGNVAGLGLDFSPIGGNLGVTLIERGCNALQGSGSYTGNYSIFRWYRITPATIRALNINNYYYWGGTSDPELNGHIESELIMFQRVQYGTDNPIYWEPRNTTAFPSSDYISSTTTHDITLNYILITLGSLSNPLPVDYLYIKAFCKDNYNIIQWQTLSEYNNKGFILEKSDHSFNWNFLAYVEGQNFSNSINNYQVFDYTPFRPVTYYRLIQIDNNGQTKHSDTIAAFCNSQNFIEDFYPHNSNENWFINIYGIPNNEYQLLITNSIGQILNIKKIKLSQPNETIIFNYPLAAGIYYIKLISKNKNITKPFVVW